MFGAPSFLNGAALNTSLFSPVNAETESLISSNSGSSSSNRPITTNVEIATHALRQELNRRFLESAAANSLLSERRALQPPPNPNLMAAHLQHLQQLIGGNSNLPMLPSNPNLSSGFGANLLMLPPSVLLAGLKGLPNPDLFGPRNFSGGPPIPPFLQNPNLDPAAAALSLAMASANPVKQKSTPKWNVMHVKIAWKIYHNQQREKRLNAGKKNENENEEDGQESPSKEEQKTTVEEPIATESPLKQKSKSPSPNLKRKLDTPPSTLRLNNNHSAFNAVSADFKFEAKKLKPSAAETNGLKSEKKDLTVT